MDDELEPGHLRTAVAYDAVQIPKCMTFRNDKKQKQKTKQRQCIGIEKVH